MSESQIQIQTGDQPVLANLYMSYAPSIKFVFKNGSVANFVNHRFFTSNPEEIKELDQEIKVHKHPSFYINPRETRVNPAEQDPMSRLRKRIIEEYLASQAAQNNPQNDRGNTTPQQLNPTSTTNIAAVAAGGNAQQVHAKLAQLLPQGFGPQK